MIKILGVYIRYDLNFDTHVGKLFGTLHNRIHQVRTITKYTTFKTRLSFINAYVIGKLNYILPLYLNLNQNIINKLHKVVMTSARCAIGSYCFKKSIKYILKKCKLLNIKNMILYSSLNFIHKIISEKKPKALTDTYKNLITRRAVVDIYPFYCPKQKSLKNFILYKGISLYNQLSTNFKSFTVKKFKTSIRKYIEQNYTSDTMD